MPEGSNARGTGAEARGAEATGDVTAKDTGDGATDTRRILGEFEYALAITHLAFERWTTKCMAAAGETGLAPTDILVLAAVHHRARSTRLSDVAFVLNVDDSHVIAYSLRKLVKMGYLEGDQRGKEKFYATTPEGSALYARYTDNQQSFLVKTLAHFPGSMEEIEALSQTLRAMSGFYDQAARRAATQL